MKTCDICGAVAAKYVPSYYSWYPHIVHFDLCGECERKVTSAVMLAICEAGVPVELIPERLRPQSISSSTGQSLAQG